MDNSSLMNRENKKRTIAGVRSVPPRYQTEEESEQAIRNAHKKDSQEATGCSGSCGSALRRCCFGIYYYDRYHLLSIIRSCGRRAWQRKIRKQQ